MHVKNILSAKGSNVVSIEPTATLETAVRTLTERKIGALLVLGPDRRVIGILSERDIVRVLAQQGASGLAQPLSQVMTRTVVTWSSTGSRRWSTNPPRCAITFSRRDPGRVRTYRVPKRVAIS